MWQVTNDNLQSDIWHPISHVCMTVNPEFQNTRICDELQWSMSCERVTVTVTCDFYIRTIWCSLPVACSWQLIWSITTCVELEPWLQLALGHLFQGLPRNDWQCTCTSYHPAVISTSDNTKALPAQVCMKLYPGSCAPCPLRLMFWRFCSSFHFQFCLSRGRFLPCHKLLRQERRQIII